MPDHMLQEVDRVRVWPDSLCPGFEVLPHRRPDRGRTQPKLLSDLLEVLDRLPGLAYLLIGIAKRLGKLRRDRIKPSVTYFMHVAHLCVKGHSIFGGLQVLLGLADERADV